MITSRDIENVTFSKPPIGKRGYNEDEVDAFLDLVQADVAEYENTVADLEDQLNSRLHAPEPPTQIVQAPAPPPPSSPEPPSAQAARILALAESTAEQLTNEAQSEAERIKRDAEAKANDVLGEARYEAKKLVDSARRESDELQARIAELRKFEENYRGRLDVYIDSQLQALRADGFIEAQNPTS